MCLGGSLFGGGLFEGGLIRGFTVLNGIVFYEEILVTAPILKLEKI